MLEEKSEVSVWRTAILALAVFICVMFVGGMFSGVEAVAIAAK